MHELDTALQAAYPVALAPCYGPFEAMSECGTRYLVSADGLWLEAKLSWLHALVPYAPLDPKLPTLPYGELQQGFTFTAGPLPLSLIRRFIAEATAHGTVEHAARRHGVLCRHSQTVGEPIDRLAEFCLVRGPWNIVVLSPPASEATEQQVGAIFANVSGATGIVIAPKRIENPEGEIVVVIEDAERLSAMLRVAGRLKGLCGRVRMLLAVDRREDLAELEAALAIDSLQGPG